MKKVLSIGLAMLAFFPMCVGAKELHKPENKEKTLNAKHGRKNVRKRKPWKLSRTLYPTSKQLML